MSVGCSLMNRKFAALSAVVVVDTLGQSVSLDARQRVGEMGRAGECLAYM